MLRSDLLQRATRVLVAATLLGVIHAHELRAEQDAGVPIVEKRGYKIQFQNIETAVRYTPNASPTTRVTLNGKLIPPTVTTLAAFRLSSDETSNQSTEDDALKRFEKRWTDDAVTRVEILKRDDGQSKDFAYQVPLSGKGVPRTLDAVTGDVLLLEVIDHDEVDVPVKKSDVTMVIADGMTLSISRANVSRGYVSLSVKEAKRGTGGLLSFGVPPFVWKHQVVTDAGAVIGMYNSGGSISSSGSGTLYYSFDRTAGDPGAVRFYIANRVAERRIPFALPKLELLSEQHVAEGVKADASLPTPSREVTFGWHRIEAETQVNLVSGQRESHVSLSGWANVPGDDVVASGFATITHVLDAAGRVVEVADEKQRNSQRYSALPANRSTKPSAKRRASMSTKSTLERFPPEVTKIAGFVRVLRAKKTKLTSVPLEAGREAASGAATFSIREVKKSSKSLKLPVDFTSTGSPFQVYDDRPFIVEYYVEDDQKQRWASSGYGGSWSTDNDGSTTGKLDLSFRGSESIEPKTLNVLVATETVVEEHPFVIDLTQGEK